jgi:hypothetical protein
VFFGVFTFSETAFAVQSSASINVAVTTNLLQTTLGNEAISADANVTLNNSYGWNIA